MGGGAGVSIHGRFRVATENSVCVSLKPHFEVRKVFAFFSGIGGCSLVRYT
jgi:hypothetical protein